MDFKKCPRCGNFFNSEFNVCQNCQVNESLDIQKLKSYFEENVGAQQYSMQEISAFTGISSRNLNRYMVSEEFAGYIKQESTEK